MIIETVMIRFNFEGVSLINSLSDSISHHSSIQGESDSDPEGFVNTISNTLDSIFSSDSSDADVSDMEDDALESSEKPVFLTAMGPVQVDTGYYYLCLV